MILRHRTINEQLKGAEARMAAEESEPVIADEHRPARSFLVPLGVVGAPVLTMSLVKMQGLLDASPHLGLGVVAALLPLELFILASGGDEGGDS
jgi:hypothetical protein